MLRQRSSHYLFSNSLAPAIVSSHLYKGVRYVGQQYPTSRYPRKEHQLL